MLRGSNHFCMQNSVMMFSPNYWDSLTLRLTQVVTEEDIVALRDS